MKFPDTLEVVAASDVRKLWEERTKLIDALRAARSDIPADAREGWEPINALLAELGDQ